MYTLRGTAPAVRSLAVLALLCLGAPARAIAPVFAPEGIALDGYDAVEYFTSDQAVLGNEGSAYEYKGATWLFKNAANRDAFAADPENYAPQYGGYCSLTMCSCDDSPGDPKAWLIHDGKLYLNGSKKDRDKFKNRMNLCIRKADHCWQSLVDKE